MTTTWLKPIILLVLCMFSMSKATEAQPKQTQPSGGLDKIIEIHISTPSEANSAVGLILSNLNATQKPALKAERLDENTLLVPVPYKTGEVGKDSMATAFVITKKGELVFGNIRPITSSDSYQSFKRLPYCRLKKVSEVKLGDQISLFESLVKVRSDRRGNAQLKVSQIMTDAFIARLRKLEAGFGFSYDKQLSPGLTPVELIDRLSRLVEVIKTYEAAKDSTVKKAN